MNNLRLLAGVLCVLLPGVGALCQNRRVVTLEEIYRTAEAGSAKPIAKSPRNVTPDCLTSPPKLQLAS